MLLSALLLAAAPLSGQADPDSILQRAIQAAGGGGHLAQSGVLEWEANATVHVPGREIALRGTWRIRPPDSAIVMTYEAAGGPADSRRLILAGTRGWSLRRGAFTPMPADVLAEERHQFYLYSLLLLLPLRRPGVLLRVVTPDTPGGSALRVEEPGNLPVTLFFDRSGRVSRLTTTFATATSETGDSQDMQLSGTIKADGIHWFRQLTIRRNGAPYFDMTLTTLRVLPGLGDTLLAGPRQTH